MNQVLSSDHVFISFTYWCLRKVFGPIIKLILIKEAKGIEFIPHSGPAVLAFNHQSFFDFICFAAVSPRNIHFLTAEKFFEHWLWNILMRITGQIKVERLAHDKSSVHLSVARHVRRGTLIGIFPEGTRSPFREEMLKAFTGVAKYALLHHVPIIPIGIIGTYDIMSKHDKSARMKKIVRIHVGEPLHFKEYHSKDHSAEICTYVTEKVIKQISILSGKKYPHYESKL